MDDTNAATYLTPLQICKFLCGVAWADAEITVEERRYITNLSQLLGLREDQYEQVQRWFKEPPDPHDIAPSRLTPQDRQNLIQQALILVSEDGNFCSDEERLITVLARSLQIPDDELEDLHERVSVLFKALPSPQAEQLNTRMLVSISEGESTPGTTPGPPPPPPAAPGEGELELSATPSLSTFSWDAALASRDSDDLLSAINTKGSDEDQTPDPLEEHDKDDLLSTLVAEATGATHPADEDTSGEDATEVAADTSDAADAQRDEVDEDEPDAEDPTADDTASDSDAPPPPDA